MIKKIIDIIKWCRNESFKCNKSIFKIIADFLYLKSKLNKLTRNEYSNYKLHSAPKEFRETFLPYNKAMEYWRILNPNKYAVLARDKFISHALLRNIGISTAKLYFAYDKETDGTYNHLILHSIEDIIYKVQQLQIKQFVVKPAADSAHGEGVNIYDIDEIVEFGGSDIKIDEILSCVSKGGDGTF